MAEANPGWQAVAAPAPDGDADIDAAAIESFAAPRCERCGGLLKPDVVFFGENVPVERYEAAQAALADADALLVAGSSLMVYSGFRFVRQAHEAGLPIAIVNRGRTRGDDLADLKVEGDVGVAADRRDRRRRVSERGATLTSSALGSDADDAVGPGLGPAHTVRARGTVVLRRLLVARDLDLRRGLLAHVAREVDRHLRARLGGEPGNAVAGRPGLPSWRCRRIRSRRHRRP